MGNALTSNPDLEAMRPGNDLVPVTPNDDEELPVFGKALRCVEPGIVVVVTAANTERVWELFFAGEIIYCGVKRVRENSTASPSVATTATVEVYTE